MDSEDESASNFEDFDGSEISDSLVDEVSVWEQSDESSDDGYGGRGRPEKVHPVVLLIGDILEFEWESILHSGIVEEIPEPYVQIKHLDSKYVGKSFQYLIARLNRPPNWITVKDELRSKTIRQYSELRERMCISFQAIDNDETGNPIVRTGIVLELLKK